MNDTQIQQLQNDNILLKARIFDIQEIANHKQEEINQYIALIKDVVNILDIKDDGKGVAAEAIIGAIKALLPHPLSDVVVEE